MKPIIQGFPVVSWRKTAFALPVTELWRKR
jgi:hypothetical protein